MQKCFFLALLVIQMVKVAAQPLDSLFTPLFSIEAVASFAIDPLGQLLVMDKSGKLTQHNAKGDAIFQYHNTTAGAIYSIDASDPFNVLLFFKESQQIVLLDRTLSERASLDLRFSSVLYATAITRSHANQLWPMMNRQARWFC
ncbi:MAG: hypothetical protein R2795_08660 [Saprospiraceae bacterium]